MQQRQVLVAPCSAFDVVCRARDIAQPNTQTQPTNKGRTSRLQNCAHSRLWAIRDLFQIGHTSVASPRVMLGVGGILSGQDVFEKLIRGAQAVQVYTALVYLGPWVVVKLLRELSDIFSQKGVKSLSEIIGSYY